MKPAPVGARDPTNRPIVTFVTRDLDDRWNDIGSVIDVNSVSDRVRNGIDVWIVQTYLELKATQVEPSFSVEIARRFPTNQPAIAHRDDLRAGATYYRSYLANTRADRAPVLSAAWHIVQNPTQVDERSVLIPHWPQSGLIPRDSARQGIRTLGYFGRLGSIPGFFRDPAFIAELTLRGIGFNVSGQDWRNYSGIDVSVALRFDPEIGSHSKPFSKLVNAWLARVPALLGSEPAYRWLRKNELDYLEVHSARDILAALDRLKKTPGLYQAMVENGAARAREFDREAVLHTWLRFMDEQFLPGWRVWNRHRQGSARRLFDYGRALYIQRRQRNVYKRIEAAQQAALQSGNIGERMERD